MSERNNIQLELNSLLSSYQEMVTNNTNMMQSLFSEMSARITNNERALLDLIRLEYRRLNIQDGRTNELTTDSINDDPVSNDDRPVNYSRERRTTFRAPTSRNSPINTTHHTATNSPINTTHHTATNSPTYPMYTSQRYQNVDRRPVEINTTQMNNDNIYDRILDNLRTDNPVQNTSVASSIPTSRLLNSRNSQYFQNSLNRSTVGLNNFFEGFDNLLTESFSELLEPVIVRPSEQQIQNATRQTSFHNIIRPVNSRCPVTLVEFTDNTPVTMIIRCGHVFSPDELNHWFQSNVRCPICRFDIRNHSQADETISDYDITTNSLHDDDDDDMDTDSCVEDDEDQDNIDDSISHSIQQSTIEDVEMNENFTAELYDDLYNSNHSEEYESEIDEV